LSPSPQIASYPIQFPYFFSLILTQHFKYHAHEPYLMLEKAKSTKVESINYKDYFSTRIHIYYGRVDN